MDERKDEPQKEGPAPPPTPAEISQSEPESEVLVNSLREMRIEEPDLVEVSTQGEGAEVSGMVPEMEQSFPEQSHNSRPVSSLSSSLSEQDSTSDYSSSISDSDLQTARQDYHWDFNIMLSSGLFHMVLATEFDDEREKNMAPRDDYSDIFGGITFTFYDPPKPAEQENSLREGGDPVEEQSSESTRRNALISTQEDGTSVDRSAISNLDTCPWSTDLISMLQNLHPEGETRDGSIEGAEENMSFDLSPVSASAHGSTPSDYTPDEELETGQSMILEGITPTDYSDGGTTSTFYDPPQPAQQEHSLQGGEPVAEQSPESTGRNIPMPTQEDCMENMTFDDLSAISNLSTCQSSTDLTSMLQSLHPEEDTRVCSVEGAEENMPFDQSPVSETAHDSSPSDYTPDEEQRTGQSTTLEGITPTDYSDVFEGITFNFYDPPQPEGQEHSLQEGGKLVEEQPSRRTGSNVVIPTQEDGMENMAFDDLSTYQSSTDLTSALQSSHSEEDTRVGSIEEAEENMPFDPSAVSASAHDSSSSENTPDEELQTGQSMTLEGTTPTNPTSKQKKVATKKKCAAQFRVNES